MIFIYVSQSVSCCLFSLFQSYSLRGLFYCSVSGSVVFSCQFSSLSICVFILRFILVCLCRSRSVSHCSSCQFSSTLIRLPQCFSCQPTLTCPQSVIIQVYSRCIYSIIYQFCSRYKSPCLKDYVMFSCDRQNYFVSSVLLPHQPFCLILLNKIIQ